MVTRGNAPFHLQESALLDALVQEFFSLSGNRSAACASLESCLPCKADLTICSPTMRNNSVAAMSRRGGKMVAWGLRHVIANPRTTQRGKGV